MTEKESGFLIPPWIWIVLIVVVGSLIALQLVGDAVGGMHLWIDPWLFALMLLGDALTFAGLLIGVFAIITLWLRRRPRKPVRKPQLSGIIGKDGRPL